MIFRLRELESISKSLKYYKDSFSSLDEWVKDMEAAQLKAQENQPEDSKALAELLNTQKVGPLGGSDGMVDYSDERR